MTEVGSVSLGIKLALDQLYKSTDEARLILQKQLKDQKIDINFATGQASNQLAQLSSQILTIKGAAAKDAGEAASFQKQASLLQELVRYKQQLVDIESSGISDEDVLKAKALAAELNKLNIDRIEDEFNQLSVQIAKTTEQASNRFAQLSAQILTVKGAVSKDAGEAASFQKQAALLQESVRYKQQLANIEGSGISDEDVLKAKALAAELNKLNLDRIETEFKQLSDQIARTEKQGSTFVGKLNAQAKAFQDAVAESSQYTQALGETSRQLGAAGNQINDFTQQAGQAALAFDSARAKVSTLSQDADGLAARMRSLSQELGFQSNSTELLNASYDVLSSGISDTADVAEVLKASTQGALGGFSDVGTVSDAVTTLISAYKSMGMSAKDATKIVDILAQTQDKGKITIGQYASQIGQVASTAALAGVGIEEMSAAVATATAKGQDSSSAISGVRQAIVNILKPTDEAQKYLKKFGIENASATLKTEGLVGILEKLKAGGATTDELAKIFSDVTGLATVSTLANENLGDFKTNLDAMSNSAGKAAASADKVASSMQGQLTAAMNQASEALVDLGNGVGKVTTPLLKALTFLIENFNKLPKPVKESVGLIIAVTGGAVTLVGALAGVAAALPAMTAGFTLMTGAAVAALPALVALLPIMAAIAAGVGAISFVLLVKEMGDANLAIDAANKQIEASANGAFAAASRTKSAVDELTKAKQSGRALTKQEIAEANRLYQANNQRLAQLKEDLKLAEQLPAATEEQTRSKANLVAQTQTTIKALEGQNTKLKALLPTNQKVAESNKAVEVSVESIGKKYQESNAQLEAANKLRQAEIAQSVAQGLTTEEEARQQNLDQETKYLNERLKLNQSKLAELTALKDITKDPEKLKELNAGILQAEQSLADDRLAIAQNGISQRQAAEEAALKELEQKITEAQNRITQSKSDRTLNVKQRQARGEISEIDANSELAGIDQDTIGESIRAKKQEIADIAAAEDISEKQRVERKTRATQELSALMIAQADAEIAAQEQLTEDLKRQEQERLKAIQDASKAEIESATLAAQERITAVKQAQAQGVIGEDEAAQRIAQIQAESVNKTLQIKQDELARIQALRSSGELTTKEAIEEAANQERTVIGEISGLKEQAANAAIAQQEREKQSKLTALDQQIEAERIASESRTFFNEQQQQALENQNNLYTAQSALLQAQTGLTQQRLENAIKEAEANGQTNKAEELKKKLLDEQIRTQEQQARIEVEQLKNQQEMNRLKLIEAQNSAQVAKQEAEIAISKAVINGASVEEIIGLQKILVLRGQQVDALNKQASLQGQINRMERDALSLKQQQTRESLNQQKIAANTSSNSSGSFSGGGSNGLDHLDLRGGSRGGGGGGDKPISLTNLTDRITDIGNNGNLADVFNAANLNLGLKLGLNPGSLGGSGVSLGGGIGGGNKEILGKLDQLIGSVQRPNLQISNVNDLGMAGQIYSDISRDSARSAGL